MAKRQKCHHENAEFMGCSGGYHFYAGEVWDDIHEDWYCPQCGRFLTQREVREMLKRTHPASQNTEEIPF